MQRKHINTGSVVRRSLFLLAGCLLFFGLGTSGEAQIATLNVTNFGAIGDCANITVSVTSNSAVVVTTNQFSSADVGKVVQLFGAGHFARLANNGIFGGNYRGTPTNHQDLVATILSVANGTNVTISSLCGVTMSNISCTYGTQNKTAFDNCIAAAPNPCTIHISAGNYLLLPPTALDTNFVQKLGPFDTYPAITIRKGGIHFLGDGTNLTILTGNGAWQQKGTNDWAYRGYMFAFQGPVTNDGPLIFDGIQFNGNAVRNHSPYTYWPATPTDGTGWDTSHHFSVGFGAPGHVYKSFTNCFFTQWHGETIEETSGWSGGYIDVGNCTFIDGNATAFNANFPHNYHSLFISDYNEVEEFYEAYATNVSYFQNNVVSNLFGAVMAINGALSNSMNPTYTIQSNLFYTPSGNGIQTTPAQNLIISHNTFIGNGGGNAVVLGVAGYQGSTINSNIVIQLNTFTNIFNGIAVEGVDRNVVVNVQVNSNSFYGVNSGGSFATGYGGSTNISLLGNFATNCKAIDSRSLLGQWFLDDASNEFPPWSQTDSTGKTNTITYATGMRQRITPYVINAVWAIDDAHPQKIPPGAVLQITHTGNFPAPLFASTTKIGIPTVLTPGQMVMYRWTNSIWKKISFLVPPTSLLAGPTNAP